MEHYAQTLADLLAAAAPGLSGSDSAEALQARLQRWRPRMLVLAELNGEPIGAFGAGREAGGAAPRLSPESVEHLRGQPICRLPVDVSGDLESLLAARLPDGNGSLVVGCFLPRSGDEEGNAADQGEAAWADLAASLVALAADLTAEQARLETRIQHFQAEHDTLRASHAEATAMALDEREERLQAQQEYALQLQRDITERELAQKELKRLHVQNELILNSAGEGICGLNAEGRAMFVNPAAASMLGYRPEELVGVALHETIHHTRANGLPNPPETCALCQALRGRPASRVDSEVFWRADGTAFPVEYTATPIKEGDRVAGAVITFRDITEQRLLEAQLRQAQKLESIGQLAAGIAHEINTPTQYIGDNTRFLGDAFSELAAVLEHYHRLLEAAKVGEVEAGMLEDVQRAVADIDIDFIANEIPSAIRETLDGVAQVTKIVRSMKEFSHPGGDEKQPVDLNDAIRSTLTVSRNEWKYVADVVTEFDDALPMVMCMVSDFNQVMLNLIVNAAHAIGERHGPDSSQKGTITIQTRADGDYVEVRVGDTGTGIPPAIRDRVFDPFFTTKEVGRGTGQGLAIAHSIITERHGGVIRLESEVGQGTEFIIRLPIEPKEAQHGAHSVCG